MKIHALLADLAAREAMLASTMFLAPRVRGGAVRTRVAGLVHTFVVEPSDFHGWGLFQPQDAKSARVAGEPNAALIAGYLELLTPIRMILVHRLRRGAWLAVPANRSDAAQKGIRDGVAVVNFVEGGELFDRIVARKDGRVFWFEQIDRDADPVLAARLRDAFNAGILADGLNIAGVTPDQTAAFVAAAMPPAPPVRRHVAASIMPCDTREHEVAAALRRGGGELLDFEDSGATWTVRWKTRDGERFVTRVEKRDLTVASSGICLSGEDNKFDLQSLVGVIEQRDEW